MQINRTVLTLGMAVALALGNATQAGDKPMGFFVTSVGKGNGANLGGLEGADAHCKELATKAGAGDRDWKAYLITQKEGKRGVSAHDRIGPGPWYNVRGVLIANNLTELHF